LSGNDSSILDLKRR